MQPAKRPKTPRCKSCGNFKPDAPEGAPTCADGIHLLIHHINEDDEPVTIRREPYPLFACTRHTRLTFEDLTAIAAHRAIGAAQAKAKWSKPE